MVLSNEEKLSIYLKQYLTTKSLKQTAFVSLSAQYGEGQLDPGVLNRLLKHRTKAKDETLRRLSQVIHERADATVDELWLKVNAHDFSTEEDVATLSLASGFTTWAALLLAALGVVNESGVSKVPAGIRFAFSGLEGEPDWIDNLDSLDSLKKTISGFDTIYIADDLSELLGEKKLDGFFMLRETFDKIDFPPEADTPVQVCRVAVGYGTHCYLLGNELPGLPPEKSAKEAPVAYGIVEQLDYLKDLFAERHLKIFYLNNATVNKHLDTYLSYESVRESLKLGYSTTKLNLLDEHRAQLLTEIGDSINDETRRTVVALVGFEPILNRIYHQLDGVLPDNPPIGYQYLNLSKLINDVSTYCLYCHPDVIRNPYKLLKVNEFLSLINAQFEFNSLNSSSIAELLFPDDKRPDVLNHDRLRRTFDELRVRNNILPFVNMVSRMVIKSV